MGHRGGVKLVYHAGVNPDVAPESFCPWLVVALFHGQLILLG
jgi:hypothetical protein